MPKSPSTQTSAQGRSKPSTTSVPELEPWDMTRPFLKWAGNKYKILGHILPVLNAQGTGRLLEPFVGSGAVFLNAGFSDNVLSDINPDIINLYNLLQKESEKFIADCQILFSGELNHPEAYLSLRTEFNESTGTYRRSLLFVYLNRHCFNGLCRYNSKGIFNVPFGKYKKPYFPEKELSHFAKAAAHSTFLTQSFEETFAAARPGDVIYCDPPYVPLLATASFSAYSADGFGLENQKELVSCARKAAKRGASVIVSNHDNAMTRQLYDGAHLESFDVQRFISCNGSQRNKAPELIAIFKAS